MTTKEFDSTGGTKTVKYTSNCETSQPTFNIKYESGDGDWLTITNGVNEITLETGDNTGSERVAYVSPKIGSISCDDDSVKLKVIQAGTDPTPPAPLARMRLSQSSVSWNYAQGVANEVRNVYVSVDGVSSSDIRNIRVTNTNPNNFNAYVNNDNSITIVTQGVSPTHSSGDFLGNIIVKCDVGATTLSSNLPAGWKRPECNCDDTLDIPSELSWASDNVAEQFINMSGICTITNPSYAWVVNASSHFNVSYYSPNKLFRISPNGVAPVGEDFTGKIKITYDISDNENVKNCSNEVKLVWNKPSSTTSDNATYCQRAYLGNRFHQWLMGDNSTRFDYLHLDNSSYHFADENAVKTTSLPQHFDVSVGKDNRNEYTFTIRKKLDDPPKDHPYNEYCEFEYRLKGYNDNLNKDACTDAISLYWSNYASENVACSCKEVYANTTLIKWRNDDTSTRFIRVYHKKGTSCLIKEDSVTVNALTHFSTSITKNTNNGIYDGTYTISITPLGDAPSETINDRLEISCTIANEMECNKCIMIPLTWEKNITGCTDLDFYTPSMYVGRLKAYEEEYEISKDSSERTFILCSNTTAVTKVEVDIIINGQTTKYTVTSDNCVRDSGSQQWVYLEEGRSVLEPCSDFIYGLAKINYYIEGNTTGSPRIVNIVIKPYLNNNLCSSCIDGDWGPCNTIKTRLIQKA